MRGEMDSMKLGGKKKEGERGFSSRRSVCFFLSKKRKKETYVGTHSTPVTPKKPTQIPLNTARGAPLPPSQ